MAKRFGKRYGDVSTHLVLRGKALEYYNGTTPISIYERETDDGYRYDLDDCGFKYEGFTEADLVEYLECMQSGVDAVVDEENRLISKYGCL